MTTLYAGSSMKVDSFWRCTGSAGVYLSVESGKDTADEKFVRCAGFQNFPF